jgi:hypothetical protein
MNPESLRPLQRFARKLQQNSPVGQLRVPRNSLRDFLCRLLQGGHISPVSIRKIFGIVTNYARPRTTRSR